jgi:hypothetical protein
MLKVGGETGSEMGPSAKKYSFYVAPLGMMSFGPGLKFHFYLDQCPEARASVSWKHRRHQTLAANTTTHVSPARCYR